MSWTEFKSAAERAGIIQKSMSLMDTDLGRALLASPLCPCGSGLPMDDDRMCIACFAATQPQMVRDIEPWIARHRARHDAGDYDIKRELQADAEQDVDVCPACYGTGWLDDEDERGWLIECACQVSEVTR